MGIETGNERPDDVPVSLEKLIQYLDDLREFFEDLAKRDKRFSYVLTLSRPDDSWKGERGRVTAACAGVRGSKDLEVYLCGGMNMIKDMRKLFLDKGVLIGKIHIEQFFVEKQRN